MINPLRRHAQTTDERMLEVLEHTYPAWRICRSRAGMWSAVRAAVPTLAQAEAGVLRYIVQPTSQALAAVLAQQLEIAQRIRG